MPNNPLFYDATVIAAINAVTALLNNGFIAIYTGAQPALDGAVTGTQLVEMQFGATAFASATATSGVVTAVANAIANGTAGNTGTAGYFVLFRSNNSTVVMTGSVGLSNADLILSSLSIVATGTVTCVAFLVTEVQT